MSTTTMLSKEASGKDVEQKLYRYQANPKESYLMLVKRIICYMHKTLDYGLWYPYDFFLVIVGYSNVDWVENVEDRKNTFGAFFFFYWWLSCGLA